ncbi:MAG: response regulator [Sulfuricurvum sp.]|nr:response regulator [Sulfuricurvum sp.]
MLIEDEPELLTTLENILKRYVREVYPFSDALEALEAFHALTPDVIISDIKMPNMSGLEMLQHLRDKNMDIPVIFASAFTDPHYFQDAIRLHAEYFLVKPIEVDELLQNLSKIEKRLLMQKEAVQTRLLLEEYKMIVDESTLVAKTDPQGNIIYVNERFTQISGYDRDELIGKRFSLIGHPETPDSLYEALWKTITRQQIWKGVIQNKDKGGNPFYLSMTIAPIVDESGNIIEYISINQDITAAVIALDKLKRANQFKDDFLRNITHEFRTPLNHIIGNISLLQHKIDDSKLQTHLNQIDGASSKLMEMINSLIDLSYLSNGTYVPVTEPVILDSLITSWIAKFELERDEKQLEILSYCSKHLREPFECDTKLIQHVFYQLISNAIKFNRHNGKITIMANIKEDTLIMSIKDTGIGFDESKLDEMYCVFNQVDSSISRKCDGSGIGLSLVKMITDLLGGTLNAHSSEGEGAIFTVKLPFPHK